MKHSRGHSLRARPSDTRAQHPTLLQQVGNSTMTMGLVAGHIVWAAPHWRGRRWLRHSERPGCVSANAQACERTYNHHLPPLPPSPTNVRAGLVRVRSLTRSWLAPLAPAARGTAVAFAVGPCRCPTSCAPALRIHAGQQHHTHVHTRRFTAPRFSMPVIQHWLKARHRHTFPCWVTRPFSIWHAAAQLCAQDPVAGPAGSSGDEQLQQSARHGAVHARSVRGQLSHLVRAWGHGPHHPLERRQLLHHGSPGLWRRAARVA
jgi:hypothetical protein